MSSSLADKLGRLARMDPNDRAAPGLRQEIEAEQFRDISGYYRELAATGRAGDKLSSMHWAAEAKRQGWKS